MRVGIFGGTFDPIHVGHLIVAETVRSDFPLDRVVFLPAALPPHKEAQDVTPAELRLRMCRAAIDGCTGFDVSDLEIRSGGVSYTIDIVYRMSASEEWKKHELYLLLGMDSLVDLGTWKDPEALLRRIPVLVAGRPGSDASDADPSFLRSVTFVEAPMIDISSSEIRRRVREGRSIRHRVPDGVEALIREQGLYR